MHDKNNDTFNKIINQVTLVKDHLRQLQGQTIQSNDGQILFNNSRILWKSNADAQFEQDYPKLVERLRIIKQDIENILKK